MADDFPPLPRDLDHDAHQADERGARYLRPPKAGIFVNRFTRIFVKDPAGRQPVEITHQEAARRGIDLARSAGVQLAAETFVESLLNPLDKTHDPKPAIAQHIPKDALGQRNRYNVYVPSAWLARARAAGKLPGPVDVVLWFGVGNELNRQGLRTAIERLSVAKPVAFIEVPGIEPEDPGSFGGRWGIGITDDTVRDLVGRRFTTRVTARITAIYAFSTGWMGFVGTILNDLITLSAVERVVIVDCLTPLGGAQQAFDKIMVATRRAAKVVTYASSEGGTTGLRARKLILNLPARGVSFLDRPIFQVLTHARMLKAGIEDGIVPWSDIDPSRHAVLRALFRTLPPRGTVVSDPKVYDYVHGSRPTGAVTLDDWHRSVRRLASVFLDLLWTDRGTGKDHSHGPGRALTRLIWDNQLPGWPGRKVPMATPLKPRDLVEGQHDFIPFEFFWETLR